MPYLNSPFPTVDNMSLKHKIRMLLEERNISQTKLAEDIGMPQPNLNKKLSLNNDSHRFTLEQIWAIADYFNVSVDDLLGRKPKPNITTLKERCIFLADLIERGVIRYNKFERDESYESPIDYDENGNVILDNKSGKKHSVYYSFYFPNYFSRKEAKDEEEYVLFDNTIRSGGNDISPNIKTNEFLCHFIEAFEKHKSGEYSDDVYQILLDAYYKMLE